MTEDELTEDEMKAADAQIRSALFDAEMGSTSWASGDIPPELQKQFHDQVRAFHAADGSGRVTIGSLIEGVDLPDPDSFSSEGEAFEAVKNLMTILGQKAVLFEPPHHIAPTRLYRFLLTDFMAHEIASPNPMMPALIPLGEIDPEMAPPPAAILAAEAFLITLLTLDQPQPLELFHKVMRLDDDVVPREAALVKATQWREQWSAIRPLSFAPGPVQEQDGFIYQFVQVSLEATDKQGETKTIEWTGVVQLILIEEELLVYGCAFEGEKGGFEF
jgi:hypothetical protein